MGFIVRGRFDCQKGLVYRAHGKVRAAGAPFWLLFALLTAMPYSSLQGGQENSSQLDPEQVASGRELVHAHAYWTNSRLSSERCFEGLSG